VVVARAAIGVPVGRKSNCLLESGVLFTANGVVISELDDVGPKLFKINVELGLKAIRNCSSPTIVELSFGQVSTVNR
jgi:hypothetical protein